MIVRRCGEETERLSAWISQAKIPELSPLLPWANHLTRSSATVLVDCDKSKCIVKPLWHQLSSVVTGSITRTRSTQIFVKNSSRTAERPKLSSFIPPAFHFWKYCPKAKCQNSTGNAQMWCYASARARGCFLHPEKSRMTKTEPLASICLRLPFSSIHCPLNSCAEADEGHRIGLHHDCPFSSCWIMAVQTVGSGGCAIRASFALLLHTHTHTQYQTPCFACS